MNPSMQTQTNAPDLARDARETWDTAKRAAGEKLDAQKGTLTNEIEALTRALQAAAESLDEQHGRAAGYTRRAAEKLQDVGQRLSDRNLSDFMTDVERVVRKQPLLLGGAAALLGYIGSRALHNTRSAKGQPSGSPSGASESQYGASGSQYQAEVERTRTGGM